jgi:biotin carboxylase
MAPDEVAATRRPRLAFVYEPSSFATLALFEAADGLCELIWVADVSRPEVGAVAALLRRLGSLVDVAGLTIEEAAAAIAVLEPAGILALADDALRWTADVAAVLDLSFHSAATARRLTDKFAQRRALAEGGLTVPKSWVLPGAAASEELSALCKEVRFPAVLKPRVGEGSRDTFLVTTFEDVVAGVETALADDVRDLVVEEYIADGPAGIGGEGFAGYVSVESYVSAGRVRHLAVNGRTEPAPPFRETGFFVPGALDDAPQRDVLQVAEAAAVALGVTTGCLHTEIKLSASGPVVIEVNGRIGGGVPELLHAATGARFLTMAFRLALGEVIELDGPLDCEVVAFLLYVHAPPEVRVVTAIEGVDELRALQGVDEVVLRRGPGSRVDWREGNHGHVLSVFGRVADHHELRELIANVGTTLRIIGG